jgi:lactate permease
MTWAQNYDPFGNGLLSALVAAVPVVVLLGAIGLFHVRAHIAALMGLCAGLAVAVLAFGMPIGLALRAAGFGAPMGCCRSAGSCSTSSSCIS